MCISAIISIIIYIIIINSNTLLLSPSSTSPQKKIRTKWTKGYPFSLKIVAHFYIKVCHQYSIQFTIQIKQSLSEEVKCNLRIPLCSLWLCTTRPLITVISHPTPCKVNRVERYLLFFEQAQMRGHEVGKIFIDKVCVRQARNPKQIWPVDCWDKVSRTFLKVANCCSNKPDCFPNLQCQDILNLKDFERVVGRESGWLAAGICLSI